MTLEEIKELIAVVQQSGVAELEVQRGENRVRIRRSYGAAPQEYVLAGPPTAAMAAPTLAPMAMQPQVAAPAGPSIAAAGAMIAAAAAAPAMEIEPEKLTYVKSPIVGTYYESPSPGSAPFVSVGDRITPGKVLCIIESMKLMNEIEAETAGVIVTKLVANGQPVEYGEALFALRPL